MSEQSCFRGKYRTRGGHVVTVSPMESGYLGMVADDEVQEVQYDDKGNAQFKRLRGDTRWRGAGVGECEWDLMSKIVGEIYG